MSHTYKVGYETGEESHYWEFEHDDILDRAALMLALKRSLLTVMRIEEVRRASDLHGLLAIEDLFETPAFLYAMKGAGFRPLEYEQCVSLDGWARIGPGRSPCDDVDTRGVLDFLRTGGGE